MGKKASEGAKKYTSMYGDWMDKKPEHSVPDEYGQGRTSKKRGSTIAERAADRVGNRAVSAHFKAKEAAKKRNTKRPGSKRSKGTWLHGKHERTDYQKEWLGAAGKHGGARKRKAGKKIKNRDWDSNY